MSVYIHVHVHVVLLYCHNSPLKAVGLAYGCVTMAMPMGLAYGCYGSNYCCGRGLWWCCYGSTTAMGVAYGGVVMVPLLL